VITIRLANHDAGISEYVKRTLLYIFTEKETLDRMVRESIDELIKEELIVAEEDCYQATTLGAAIVAAGLSPMDGLFVHQEIKHALQRFVMVGLIHLQSPAYRYRIAIFTLFICLHQSI
jgi:hypothetical protein